MSTSLLKIGLIGAGKNTRHRHIPGLLALPDVKLQAVCNRRSASTMAVAREFAIPKTYEHWEDLVADPEIEAVVIGAWPYLHCPITLACLATGKHVLCEARLSLDAAEAHRMLKESLRHPKIVTQVVPSPFGLKGHEVMVDLLQAGYLGELREVHVSSMSASLADPAAPLSWRQDSGLSGFNMLALGIIHETLLRWAPPPLRVLAQAHAFIPARIDPESGVRRNVGTPDSVQVLAVLENGARATYLCSGVTWFGQSTSIRLHGSEGTLHYDFIADRIHGANRQSGSPTDLPEIPIPAEKAGSWQVESEFVQAIRTGTPIRFTDFATGVSYMEFTEAVARSAQRNTAIDLPLEEFRNDSATRNS